MSMQYTIRSVPDATDRAVRRRAKREAKSLNAVVVEALARGLELDTKPATCTDLDHLIGTWQEDPELDAAIADFARVDEDAWKRILPSTPMHTAMSCAETANGFRLSASRVPSPCPSSCWANCALAPTARDCQCVPADGRVPGKRERCR